MHYLVNGLIENSNWGDFCCEVGPNVTISKIESGQAVKIQKHDDGWYDADVATFNRQTIIAVLALINGCQPENIELEEHDKVIFME